jgi:hypothetical protein
MVGQDLQDCPELSPLIRMKRGNSLSSRPRPRIMIVLLILSKFFPPKP